MAWLWPGLWRSEESQPLSGGPDRPAGPAPPDGGPRPHTSRPAGTPRHPLAGSRQAGNLLGPASWLLTLPHIGTACRPAGRAAGRPSEEERRARRARRATLPRAAASSDCKNEPWRRAEPGRAERGVRSACATPTPERCTALVTRVTRVTRIEWIECHSAPWALRPGSAGPNRWWSEETSTRERAVPAACLHGATRLPLLGGLGGLPRRSAAVAFPECDSSRQAVARL